MSATPDKIVFVPACLLCPSYMATSKYKSFQWRQSIVALLIEKEYSIIQLPCPEASFIHPECGIGRATHGVQYYEKLQGFREHCFELSRQVVDHIYELTVHGYTVSAILGIEHSPTCAVNYIYTHQGMKRRAGIFVEELNNGLAERNLIIPIIGINRRYPNKTIHQIVENHERE